jgi:CRISPR-associated helicase Cas3
MNIKIGPRFIKQDKDGFRPFQSQTLEAIRNSDAKLVFVEAPVGAGKSHLIRKLLEVREFERKPLIFTYPTKILMESQIGSIGKEIVEEKLGIWPYSNFVSNGINLFLYSTDSLLYAIRQKKIKLPINRGRLLENLFFDLQWYAKQGGIITSPDALFLLYSKEVYERSREIQNAFANAVVFFDEFHLYSELTAFPVLIEELLSKNVDKVVMLSATPFISESFKEIQNKYKAERIDFKLSIGTRKDSVFNYPLDFEFHSFKVSDVNQTIENLLPFIRNLPKPMAYISDSIFRLQHIKRCLQKQNLGNMEIKEWSGLEKEREIVLNENTIVLGTSAIEVGIDMPFESLVFEATYWTSAIQRLGRVGRKGSGKAVFFTRKDLEVFLKDKTEWDRTSFENEVLKEALPNPREDLIFGDCFRGRNYNFLLFDSELKKHFVYHEALFSMYDVNDDYEYEWQLKSFDEKKKILKGFQVPESHWEPLLIRDQLSPFWGVLRGKISNEYLERPKVVFDYNRNELSIFSKHDYFFYGG